MRRVTVTAFTSRARKLTDVHLPIGPTPPRENGHEDRFRYFEIFRNVYADAYPQDDISRAPVAAAGRDGFARAIYRANRDNEFTDSLLMRPRCAADAHL